MIDLAKSKLPAHLVQKALGLSPHPEGGHYRETWRDTPPGGARGVATSIQFLLAEGERSRWHRVDAAEIWLWQAGAPLLLGLADGQGGRSIIRLGADLAGNEVLQAVVPAGAWQEAATLGRWSLVACVVAPAFDFAGFEMAPAGWAPPDHGESMAC